MQQMFHSAQLTKHIDSADGICFNGLDRIVHVMRRWRWWRQVIDLINWQHIKEYRPVKRYLI